MSRWEYPPDGWYARDRGGLVFAGFVYGMLAALVVMLLGGCGKPLALPKVPGAIPISVVSWPAPIKAKCELSDLPAVPDVFVWTTIPDDEAGRIYITQRQLADLVVWMKDVWHWSGLATRCLEKLTEPD